MMLQMPAKKQRLAYLRASAQTASASQAIAYLYGDNDSEEDDRTESLLEPGLNASITNSFEQPSDAEPFQPTMAAEPDSLAAGVTELNTVRCWGVAAAAAAAAEEVPAEVDSAVVVDLVSP